MMIETNELRAAGQVKRCHTMRTVRQQTVAEHSHGVCMLLWKLCDREPSANLLKAAMFHDLAEHLTGDVPAPVKWQSPVMKQELDRIESSYNRVNHLEISLSPTEELMLKWADALELGWYAVDEIGMGNKFMGLVYINIMNYIEKLPVVRNGSQELYKLKEAYVIARGN